MQPQPSMALSDIKELTQHQRVDVTALVKTVSEPRNVANNRCVFDIIIMDESASEYDVQELKGVIG